MMNDMNDNLIYEVDEKLAKQRCCAGLRTVKRVLLILFVLLIIISYALLQSVEDIPVWILCAASCVTAYYYLLVSIKIEKKMKNIRHHLVMVIKNSAEINCVKIDAENNKLIKAELTNSTVYFSKENIEFIGNITLYEADLLKCENNITVAKDAFSASKKYNVGRFLIPRAYSAKVENIIKLLCKGVEENE